MSIFSEIDLDTDQWKPSELEMAGMQTQSAIAECDALLGRLEELLHRAKYHDDPITAGHIEKLKGDIKHIKLILS